MPLVTIHNRRSGHLSLPIARTLKPRGSLTVSLSLDELESAGLAAMERAGLIQVTVAQDPGVGDSFEGLTRADLNAVGTVSVSVGDEDNNVIVVTCAIVDLAGRPLTGERSVLVQSIADTDAEGALGEANPGVGAVVNFKNDADAVASSAWIRTAEDGTFDFTVTDTLAESCAVKIAADNCLVRVVELMFQ